jgi:hypothetical protein
MMMNRLEDLWKSADDGASVPIGPIETKTEAEFDDLLDAWYVERRNSIECEILLEESRKLIQRLMTEAGVSPSRKKRARQLIRAIDEALHPASSEEA